MIFYKMKTSSTKPSKFYDNKGSTDMGILNNIEPVFFWNSFIFFGIGYT